MSLATNIADLAIRVATECKALRTLINGNAADLSALNTTAKTSLVAAVNELKSTINGLPATLTINDAATNTTQVWSSSKVAAEITAALNATLGGAPAALDTLNELAAAIGNDANFASTVTTALGNRVRFDAAQTLTAPQQLQACQNIGVGDPTSNFVTTFNNGLV